MNITTAEGHAHATKQRPRASERQKKSSVTDNKPTDKDFYHPEFEVNSGDRRDPSYVPGYN